MIRNIEQARCGDTQQPEKLFGWRPKISPPLASSRIRRTVPLAELTERGIKEPYMPDSLRIAVGDLRKRMEAGEDFVYIDTRNPQAWSQSDMKLPEAIRVPLDSLDENLSKIPKGRTIVAYCT
jgi:rhodanese-like protein